MKVCLLLLICLWFEPTLQICDIPKAEDMFTESLPKTTTKFGHYPKIKIHKYIRKHKLHNEIKEANLTLAFCQFRAEKPGIPNLPSLLTAEDTCPVVDIQKPIPEYVVLNGEKCWVLEEWAGTRCSYVQCSTDECQGPTELPTIPVPTRFRCRPVNPRIVKVYAFCCNAKHKHQCTLKSFNLRLPQCCSCFKFSCGLKG